VNLKFLRFIIVITFLLQIHTKSIAQVCGGGTVKFNIYTLNGKAVKSFDYEIFPASEELTKKFNYKDNWGCGEIINGIADSMIDRNDEALNNKLKELLALSKITSKGKIKCSINFKSFETVYFPMIFKITKHNKSVYILGNYFGGCNRQASLIWTDSYYTSIH
jgi:hypothetical protein